MTSRDDEILDTLKKMLANQERLLEMHEAAQRRSAESWTRVDESVKSIPKFTKFRKVTGVIVFAVLLGVLSYVAYVVFVAATALRARDEAASTAPK